MTRGQLLTSTFKRMDVLGITAAEDIIEKLAEENEECRKHIEELEKEVYQRTPAPDAPESFSFPDTLTINIPSVRTLTININTQGDVVSPHPDD